MAGWLVVVLWMVLVVFRGMWWSPGQIPLMVLGVAGAAGIYLIPVFLLVVLPFALFLKTRTRPWHFLPAAMIGALGALLIVCAYACWTLGPGEDKAVVIRSIKERADVCVGVLLVGATTGSVAAWLTKMESREGP